MMTIKFQANDRSTPAGKLADAELHFSGGPLDGLKLAGSCAVSAPSGATATNAATALTAKATPTTSTNR